MKKFAVIAVLCAVVSTTMASVEPGWTQQCWDFATPEKMVFMEGYNPYGDPLGIISDMSVNKDLQWNQAGYWSGSAFKVILDIPNQPVENPYKMVWIDVVYQGDVSFSWVADAVSGMQFTKVEELVTDVAGTPWKKLHQVWTFEPNPREEIIVLGLQGMSAAGAAIDQICVETKCVPEPATLAILGFGAMMMLRRKYS